MLKNSSEAHLHSKCAIRTVLWNEHWCKALVPMLHQAELKKCILYKHNYTPPKQKLMHKQQRTLTLCSSEQKKKTIKTCLMAMEDSRSISKVVEHKTERKEECNLQEDSFPSLLCDSALACKEAFQNRSLDHSWNYLGFIPLKDSLH